jgi:hypothetical protein
MHDEMQGEGNNGGRLIKVTQKQALTKGENIQKMLQWIWMGSKERQWAK